MTKNEILKYGGIEFKSAYPFPYGAEFTVMEETNYLKGNWKVLVVTFPSREEEIEVAGQDLFGRRFIVISSCQRVKDHFSCMAVPAEQVEIRAKKIEDTIVSTLLGFLNK